MRKRFWHDARMRTNGVMTLPVFVAMICASAHSYAQDAAPPPPPATSSSASDVLPAPVPSPPGNATTTPLPAPPEPPPAQPALPPPPPWTGTGTAPLPAPIPGSTPPAISPNVAPAFTPSISGPGAGPTLMKTEERWYGWQTLLAATPANLVGVISILSGEPILAMAAYPLNAFAGPIVHWAHGHPGRGFASLGLNLTVPLLFGFVGTMATGTRGYGGALGINLAIATTQLIDTLGWSRETVRLPVMPPKGTQALLPSSVAFLPMIQSTQKGIMLVGQF